MKQTLLVLSDMHGFYSPGYIDWYLQALEPYYTVKCLDSRMLAGVYEDNLSAETMHRKLVYAGLDNALEVLLSRRYGKVHMLGFSVGGTIAWRYSLRTDNVQSITCVSSTRLRIENSKPELPAYLFYGEKDRYAPKADWFSNMDLEPVVLPGENHGLYTKRAIAERVADHLRKLHPLTDG